MRELPRCGYACREVRYSAASDLLAFACQNPASPPLGFQRVNTAMSRP